MAIDAPGAFSFSFVADVDFSNITRYQYTAVSLASAQNAGGEGQGNTAMVPATADTNFVGVLQTDPKVGEAGTVMFRGVTRAQCGAPWAVGDALGIDANGRFVPAGSGKAVGIGIESAVVGDISSVLLR